MSRERIVAEIHKKLDDRDIAAVPWLERQITLELCSDHAEGLAEESDHAWFHSFCDYDTCRDIVRRVMKSRAGDMAKAERSAPTLPGFDFMTPRYTVERVNDATGEIEIVGLLVENMSDEELLTKADLYDSMAETLRLHAAEIRRYVKARRRRAA